MRQRLGLSAADLARLIQVSEQSVYNWGDEEDDATARADVQALAALRQGIPANAKLHAQLEKMPK